MARPKKAEASYVYRLTNLDITMAAGGPMGNPSTKRWSRLYVGLSHAKNAAQEGIDEPIVWHSTGRRGEYSSQDLGDTIFSIVRQEVL